MAVSLIDKLAKDVNERLASGGASPETKQSVMRELESVLADIELMLEGDEGFEDVLLEHLQRERERYKADTPDDLPDWIDDDTVRRETLCTCRNSDCDIKKGKIPVAVRKADTMRKGIREFKQNHSGYPEALDAAAERYFERRGAVHQRLRLCNAALGSDVTVDALRAPSEASDGDQAVEAEADD
jgi:hypothetical protein